MEDRLDSVRCRGCWELGNNCGRCDHCKRTWEKAIEVIARLKDEVEGLHAIIRGLQGSSENG